MMFRPGSHTLLLSVLLASCSLAENKTEDEDIESAQQSVQFGYVGASESVSGRGANLVTTWSSSKVAKSVGAIRPSGETWSDGLESTCGATFISKHFAITASHCVDSTRLPTTYTESSTNATPLRVEHINASGVTPTAFYNQSYATGTFPNYTRPWPLSSGYTAIQTTCYVYSRCSTAGDSAAGNYGRNNCPSAFGVESVDIALIYCPNRPTSHISYYAALAPSTTADNSITDVEVWWFHEVVSMPTSYVADPSPYMPSDSYEHYYRIPTDSAGKPDSSQNWHYHSVGMNHQLLPLISYRDSAGTYYSSGKPRPSYISPKLGYTNVLACHGMSGSGAFKVNHSQSRATINASPVFLGPMEESCLQSSLYYLCDNLNAAAGSSCRSTYVPPKYSNWIANQTAVNADK